MSSSGVAARSWLQVASGILAVAVGQAALTVAASRLLDVDDVGAGVAAVSVATLGGLACRGGVDLGIVRSQHPALAYRLARRVVWTTCTAAVLVGAGVLSVTQVDTRLGIATLLAVVLMAQAAPLEGLAQAGRRFRQLALANLSAAVVMTGLGLWAIAALRSPVAVVLPLSLHALTRVVVLYFLVRPPPSPAGRSASPRFATESAGFTLTAFINQAATQSDYLVVGSVLGSGPLGLYSRAYQLIYLPTMLLGTAAEYVAFPSLARLQPAEQLARARQFQLVLHWTGVWLAAAVLPIVPELLVVPFGADWVDAATPARILLATLGMRLAYKAGDSYAKAAGLVGRRIVRESCYLASTICFVYLGAVISLEVASVGAALAIVINWVLASRSLVRSSAAEVLPVQVRWAYVGLSLATAACWLPLWGRSAASTVVLAVMLLVMLDSTRQSGAHRARSLVPAEIRTVIRVRQSDV